MCTILIAGKIWWIYRRTTRSPVSHSGGPNLTSPMVLIVESGAMYSTVLALQISLYASQSGAYVILLNALPQIIGINFTLIIVRVGLGLSAFNSPGASSVRGNMRNPGLFEQFVSAPSEIAAESRVSSSAQGCHCGRGIAMRPLEVHITQTTRNFRESTNIPTSIGQFNSSAHSLSDDDKGLNHQV